MTFSLRSRASFTLIELLVVIAIVAVLSVVVILTINPTELLKQSRDARRLSDMASLNTALGLFQTDQPGASLGSSNVIYVSLADTTTTCSNLGLPALPSGWSYNCVSSSSLYNVDGTGWIPVNLRLISAGAPFGALPIDPISATSSRSYYTYTASSGVFEVTAVMESSKYQGQEGQDGGADPTQFERGTSVSLSPFTHGLIGHWTFDDGSGTTAADASGFGNTGTLVNSPTWVTDGSCKVGNCLSFDGSTNFVSIPTSTNFSTVQNGITAVAWIKLSGTANSTSAVVGHGQWDYTMVANAGGGASRVYVWNNAGSEIGSASGNVIATGTWANIATVIDYPNLKSYIYNNGTLVRSVNINGTMSSFNNALTIGSDPHGAIWRFKGSIDEVYFYDRALSAAEIAAIYGTAH